MRPIDEGKTLESMLVEDRALERSVSFGVCFVGQQNIMGDDAVDHIKRLTDKDGLTKYNLKRSEPWDAGFPKEQESRDLKELTSGDGDPPSELFDRERLTHRDIKVQNLIKPRLWGKTVWRGAGFAIHEDGTPELTLLFEEGRSAENIFSDLKKTLGGEDEDNRLNVTIIRNINKNNPAHYRLCISERASFGSAKQLQLAMRMQTMTPSDRRHLNSFLAMYKKAGRYIFSYAELKTGQTHPVSYEDRISLLSR